MLLLVGAVCMGCGRARSAEVEAESVVMNWERSWTEMRYPLLTGSLEADAEDGGTWLVAWGSSFDRVVKVVVEVPVVMGERPIDFELGLRVDEPRYEEPLRAMRGPQESGVLGQALLVSPE